MTNTIHTDTRTDANAGYPQGQRSHVPTRRSAETKLSLKTSELIAYLGAVTAVVLTALIVSGNDQGSADPFGAAEALRYITWLTIGYMVARGLAKSGSHENHSAS
ncbi:hypothetical protein [Mycobacterium asiaticum]|uniref:hypothetical protein n=1 Tax=Mycobacterium asiaticum TaxID=1790 RepID=UPI00055B2D21|nr:hypothetical protein [Mycobacterium asiaticum]ORA09025.1 hypothetical protein BST16_25600 [Mycobacterium asiaticum DSM 44297]